MADYIKRDKSLLIWLSNSAYEQVQKVPAADVVEVVRCKNCKNRYLWLFCGYFGDEDYCPKGVKMDEEVLNK